MFAKSTWHVHLDIMQKNCFFKGTSFNKDIKYHYIYGHVCLLNPSDGYASVQDHDIPFQWDKDLCA